MPLDACYGRRGQARGAVVFEPPSAAARRNSFCAFWLKNALMNQFQFYLALGGLKEAGFIREARHLEGTLLILTPQGRGERWKCSLPASALLKRRS